MDQLEKFKFLKMLKKIGYKNKWHYGVGKISLLQFQNVRPMS